MCRALNQKHAAAQTEERPFDLRPHFDEFAAQLRRRRHAEHRRRILGHRKVHLQKAVALTGRLQRLSSWLHNGLVQISKSQDASAFVRVHQHLLEVTSRCLGRWKHDIRAFDPLDPTTKEPDGSDLFLSRISQAARNDCLEFIQNVRRNPKFLVDRFKAVSPSQLVALSKRRPEYHVSKGESYASQTGSFQRFRLNSFAKELEGYVNFFERRNPMAFLLHNCYGSNSSREDLLRLETWSSVCANLYLSMKSDHFFPFLHQVLWEFAGLGEWRAKPRLELFLMDILQRGAFLLEPVSDFKKGALDAYIADTLATETAQQFFDHAVCELFTILAEEDGGFPIGVLQLIRAMLAKIPDETAHVGIRYEVLGQWFFNAFLKTAIFEPENRTMLLQFYISHSARSTILAILTQKVYQKAHEMMANPPSCAADEELARNLQLINGQMYDEPLPSGQDVEAVHSKPTDSLTICMSDLISILEALSQQYAGSADNFERDAQSIVHDWQFQRQLSGKLNKLRLQLELQMEPGHSSDALDLLQEEWLALEIDASGGLQTAQSTASHTFATLDSIYQHFTPLNTTDKALIRLAFDPFPEKPSLRLAQDHTDESIRDQFIAKSKHARSVADMVDARFWTTAINFLDKHHSLSDTVQSDTRLLRPLFRRLTKMPESDVTGLEDQVVLLEAGLARQQRSLDEAAKHFQHLKFNMWYTMDVVHSREYESARNISRALNFMSRAPQALLEVSGRHSSRSSDRPSTSTSTTSSIFEQPKLDTVKILKAPPEHGGPKKLADEQIGKTKAWLSRDNVDNFCKGEERIHRFCMEIKTLARKLVSEGANESPTLWYSQLWAKEKNWFDVGAQAVSHLPGPSRAPSVLSEHTSASPWSRPTFVSQPSGRSLDSDHSRAMPAFVHGMPRAGQDVFSSDWTSSLSSGHRYNANNAHPWTGFSPAPSQPKSVTSGSALSQPSSIFTSSVSHSRSATSASMPSRPGSLYGETHIPKLVDTAAEKGEFLETVRESLTILLLSDLANPVWSSGSETDAWLDAHKRTVSVSERLERRRLLSSLAQRDPSKSRSKSNTRQRRTGSLDDQISGPRASDSIAHVSPGLDHEMLEELGQVLRKISRQVDPKAKLRAVREFRQLAINSLQQVSDHPRKPFHSSRRQSIGPGISAPGSSNTESTKPSDRPAMTDSELRDVLKDILLSLNPQTLFRDLQYIAAFASPDSSSASADGEALVQIGLAALASKDEICRIMVELADGIVSRDSIKRVITPADNDRERSLHRARDYWTIGAREGNAIAQRELAGLYLAHPEVTTAPGATAPLTLSREVFRSDRMWHETGEAHEKGEQSNAIDSNQRALCLALHWMQLAAEGGDIVAKQRLAERRKEKARV